MRSWLRRFISQPLRVSGREYVRAVQRHWILLVGGLIALVGTSQVVIPSVNLPYWLWLVVGFALLSWAQFLVFHDRLVQGNETGEELRIGHEARRALESTVTFLRERVSQRDLIVQFHHELNLVETLYHRTTANPVHPLTLDHVREALEVMDHRIGVFLTPIDADTARRFLAIPITANGPALITELHQKRRVLEEFIRDPKFFPEGIAPD